MMSLRYNRHPVWPMCREVHANESVIRKGWWWILVRWVVLDFKEQLQQRRREQGREPGIAEGGIVAVDGDVTEIAVSFKGREV